VCSKFVQIKALGFKLAPLRVPLYRWATSGPSWPSCLLFVSGWHISIQVNVLLFVFGCILVHALLFVSIWYTSTCITVCLVDIPVHVLCLPNILGDILFLPSPSVCPYKPRGTCVTWRTMGNSKFSLMPFIPFLLVCLFLSLVWLKMTKKIRGKDTEVQVCEQVRLSVFLSIRLSTFSLSIFTGLTTDGISNKCPGMISINPSCVHLRHVMLQCTKWPLQLKLQKSCLAFTGQTSGGISTKLYRSDQYHP
jgi:hypothetical protein